MTSKDQIEADSPATREPADAMADHRREADRVTGTPAKAAPHDPQNQATTEEFAEEGMGVASKE